MENKAMHEKSPYEIAHLLAAAVRITAYQKKGNPPDVSEVCALLHISAEEGLFLVRKLEKAGILERVEQAGAERLFIRDMQAIEALPKKNEGPEMTTEIEAFQSRRQNRNLEIENFQKKQKEKQKALFAELNRKLGKGESP
jgi:DNA-binding Lrp family transcriptional regulator